MILSNTFNVSIDIIYFSFVTVVKYIDSGLSTSLPEIYLSCSWNSMIFHEVGFDLLTFCQDFLHQSLQRILICTF